jgi:hypothetical protein
MNQMVEDKKGISGKQHLEFIRTVCKPTTTIISDEFSGCKIE